jgi:hypothetical protein
MSSPHIITFTKNGESIEYLFDKSSTDVDFVEYVKNSVISVSPRIEETVEKWHIKSLDRDVEFKTTRKYTKVSKIAERRDWESYGTKNTNTMENTLYGEDTFFEWSPSILKNPKNLKYIENYCNDNYRVQYHNNIPKTTSDLIYINTTNKEEQTTLLKYENEIARVNKISDGLNALNKKQMRETLSKLPKTYIENNLDVKATTGSSSMMKDIAKTNESNTENGLFVPVHLRTKFKNMQLSIPQQRRLNKNRGNSHNSDDKLFKVHKRLDQPKFTFVVKGIPYPDSTSQSEILESLCKTSYTLRQDPKMASVFILKDKETRKYKNMCLVNFRKEELKNKVLQECQSSRVLMDNCILNIEDGRNN